MDQTTITGIIIAAFGATFYLLWDARQKTIDKSDRDREAARLAEKVTFERIRIDEKISLEKARLEDRGEMKETLTRIQSSIDKQTGSQKELSDAINKVSSMFDKLNLTLQMVERESSNRFTELEKRISVVESHVETLRLRDIEGLRERIHDVFSNQCAMRMQGEKLNGWKFERQWKLTGFAQKIDENAG